MSERVIDFNALGQELARDNVDAVKALVTRENVASVDWRGAGAAGGADVIVTLCTYGCDNPTILRYFLGLGAPTQNCSIIFVCVLRGKPKLLRVLMDATKYVAKDDQFFWPCERVNALMPLLHHALFINSACARVLLDAGAKLHQIKWTMKNPDFEWVHDFMNKRECARTSAAIVLGIVRCGSRVLCRDMLKLIARCVWETRGQTDEWIQDTSKKLRLRRYENRTRKKNKQNTQKE